MPLKIAAWGLYLIKNWHPMNMVNTSKIPSFKNASNNLNVTFYHRTYLWANICLILVYNDLYCIIGSKNIWASLHVDCHPKAWIIGAIENGWIDEWKDGLKGSMICDVMSIKKHC